MPDAIKFAEENNLEFYVLLVDAEDDRKVDKAIVYLKNVQPNIQIAIVTDKSYGTSRKVKNKNFLSEITPKHLENIEDYSKYILLDNTGSVLMVTNYKDSEGTDKDDSAMLAKKYCFYVPDNR